MSSYTFVLIAAFAAIVTYQLVTGDLTSDIQSAQEKLTILELEKSHYNAIILNVTANDINQDASAIVTEIISKMHTLQVEENVIADFSNFSLTHRDAILRAGYDLSYTNDVFGNLAQEINTNLGNNDLGNLRISFNELLLYQLRLNNYYLYFHDLINFTKEEELILEAIEGLEGPVVSEILQLVENVQGVLTKSIQSLDEGLVVYQAAIREANTSIEIIIEQIPE